jgi:putative transposase
VVVGVTPACYSRAMYRSFRYRLYPTRQQARALKQMLDTHRHLYNRALAERRDAWAQERRRVRYGEQSAQLKPDRLTNPYLAQTNFSSCQATLRRLDKAFYAFFRRVEQSDPAGYPRFKGPDRFHTVEFPSYGDGCKLDGNRVYFQHVGKVRLVLHRPIAGTIKTLAFTRRADNWYLIASCDLGEPPQAQHAGPAVGIDVGLATFATFSTGEQIPNPRFFRRDEQLLARAQRRLSIHAKGTPEREHHKRIVRRLHERIANRRKDFAHTLSRRLVNEFGVIVFEGLSITRMIKNHRLAKSIADAAWKQLVTYTQYKVAETGAVCIQIDPRGTSQRCSACSMVVQKDLSVRVHRCPTCGLEIDRDLNAALNILALGLQRIGSQSVEAVSF